MRMSRIGLGALSQAFSLGHGVTSQGGYTFARAGATADYGY
jgi:hypothetical protein